MLATGIGAIPVFFFLLRAANWRGGMIGFAIGVMGMASILGLLIPSIESGGFLSVAGGLAAGIGFLVGARMLLHNQEEVSFAGLKGDQVRTSLLVFAVLLVHSLPEGFAMGSAYASDVSGLALFVIVAIALQNIPEGTAVAIPMEAAGYSRSRQFWSAVITSVPQPIGAVLAYVLVEQIQAILPFSLAFAAGAMLALIVSDLIPEAREAKTPRQSFVGLGIGFAVMILLSFLIGV